MSIVFTEDRGSVRHVILNRPEKRNAMNQELLLALGEALREAAAAEHVHCVVLRGEGPVFSAGVDLGELGQSTGQVGLLRPFRKVFLDCANACEEMAKPVVCQIRRACLGGALEVALGCDLRVADSEAQLGPPGGQVRDHPRRRRLHPPARRRRPRTRQGDDHDGAHDRRPGGAGASASSTASSPPAELEDATDALVEELLANSHIAVGRAKRVIDASARPTIAQSLEMEIDVQEFCVAAAAGALQQASPQPEGALAG